VTDITGFSFRDRYFSADDVRLEQEVVASYPTLARCELASTVAEVQR
jgi:hypothetical protein